MGHMTDAEGLVCETCGERRPIAHPDYPGLCPDCRRAFCACDMICAGPQDWVLTNSEIVRNALARFKNDTAAIRVMREYAVLLRLDGAFDIFSPKCTSDDGDDEFWIEPEY
jgi:hypothetical protein